MGFELSYLYNITNNLEFVGTEWLITTAMMIIILISITRDMNQMKILAFPLTLTMQVSGLKMGIITMTITGMIFAIETFSIQLIGETLGKAIKIIEEPIKQTISLRKKIAIPYLDRKMQFKQEEYAKKKGLVMPTEMSRADLTPKEKESQAKTHLKKGYIHTDDLKIFANKEGKLDMNEEVHSTLLSLAQQEEEAEKKRKKKKRKLKIFRTA